MVDALSISGPFPFGLNRLRPRRRPHQPALERRIVLVLCEARHPRDLERQGALQHRGIDVRVDCGIRIRRRARRGRPALAARRVPRQNVTACAGRACVAPSSAAAKESPPPLCQKMIAATSSRRYKFGLSARLFLTDLSACASREWKRGRFLTSMSAGGLRFDVLQAPLLTSAPRQETECDPHSRARLVRVTAADALRDYRPRRRSAGRFWRRVRIRTPEPLPPRTIVAPSSAFVARKDRALAAGSPSV